MTISRDTKRKFDLINALCSHEKPTLHVLQETTSIPLQTIKRQIGFLRSDFGMQVRYVRVSGGDRGSNGYYTVDDWGIIDLKNFLKHYGKF